LGEYGLEDAGGVAANRFQLIQFHLEFQLKETLSAR